MALSYDPPVGIAEPLEPGLRRITAPNPGAMTFRGTNTYLIGDSDVTVLDPGPDDPRHLQAILDSIDPRQRIARIIVTHAHRDHSELADRLSQAVSAPVFAFGNALSGRSAVMQDLAKAGLIGGGEGLDLTFEPHRKIGDGDVLNASDHSLTVWHTPGHLGGHVCLQWNDCCFTGDHIMGWSTSLISPPDGNLTDFMASCAQMRRMNWRRFYPGHGDVIHDPTMRLDEIVMHRQARTRDILASLKHAERTASEITRLVYGDIPPALRTAAQRNVIAHLIDLQSKYFVCTDDPVGPDAQFRRIENLDVEN